MAPDQIPMDQAGGKVGIYRDNLNPLRLAFPEGHHPLDPDFTPQKNPISFSKSPLILIVADAADS